jgi:hypothetical protein
MRFIAHRARRDCELFLLQEQDARQAGHGNTDAQQNMFMSTQGGAYERRIDASLCLGRVRSGRN